MQLLGSAITAPAGNRELGGIIVIFGKESYVKNSGQAWKVWVFLVLLFGGFLLFTLALSRTLHLPETVAIIFVLVALGISIADFVWLSLAIRCRKCAASIGWHAMRRRDAGTWLFWLLQSDSCPACGIGGSKS